jgi:hypothetical protein
MVLIIIGLGLSTIGSLVMAISFSSIHKAYAQAFRDLQDFCNTLGSLRISQRAEFSGLPEDVEKGKTGADTWNNRGTIILTIGFLLQLIGLILSL